MNNNTMELNMNEMEQVNGGVFPWVIIPVGLAIAATVYGIHLIKEHNK